MKVLLVIDNLGAGGAQRQMSNLAIGLSKLGYTIHLFSYHKQFFFANKLIDNSIKLLNEEKKGKLGFNVIKALRKYIKNGEYKFVLSYMDTPNFYIALVKKITNTKSIFITSERFKTNFEKKNISLLLKKFAHKHADFIICNSEHEKNNWITNYPKISNKITCIYNGVDSTQFFPKSNTAVDAFKLIVIASVAYYKNGMTVLKALEILQKQYNITPVITWMGQQVTHLKAYAECLLEMKEFIKQNNLENQWIWKKPESDVNTVLHEHDALILASTEEGLPNVVCEALMVGKPVFASNVLDHPVLVKNGERGFVFNPSNPNELAQVIAKFYQLSSEVKRQLGVNARNYAIENLDNEVFINKYNNFFKQIAANNFS
jgi:glycosyltransferase involved in cell wall biosynthesis